MPIPTDNDIAEQEYNTVADAAFSEVPGEDAESQPDSAYAQYITPLSHILDGLYTEAKAERQSIELRWLKDLRQYKGEYDPEVLSKLDKNRSKAFFRQTRTKVRTVDARLNDILHPSNGAKNWGIYPTPVPQIDAAVEKQIIDTVTQQTGEPPSPVEVKGAVNDVAKDRAARMEKVIEDQLDESNYKRVIRQVEHSGSLYGTGVLKGPVAKAHQETRWIRNETTGTWEPQTIRTLVPSCHFVSVWDLYPDSGATNPEDMRHIFQRYLMPKHKVLALAKRDDFNKEAILSYVSSHPDGDAQPESFETQLRVASPTQESASAQPVNKGRYEVKEFWGYLDVEDIKDSIANVPDGEIQVMCNIWMLGPVIIKAIVSPLKAIQFPYHWYFFDKDETSFWGEGIPAIMRDPQSLVNASVRAMLDNAAISAGPLIEANMALLQPNEDPTDLYPFRVFLRNSRGMDAQSKALHVTSLPSYTREFLELVQFFMQAADEVTTIPRYLYGDTKGMSGAGATASGLSMLMSTVSITLKDQVKHFDDGITTPFISAMYAWNMQFNPDEDVKGDFKVLAKGSTSLIAKEVRFEGLSRFMELTNNPMDAPLVNRRQLLAEILKYLDLDDMGLLHSREEVEAMQQRAEQERASDKQFEKELAITKAESGGHMSDGNPMDRVAGNPARDGRMITPDKLEQRRL